MWFVGDLRPMANAGEEDSTDGEDGSDEEVRERAGVSARESAQIEVRGKSALVWRRR